MLINDLNDYYFETLQEDTDIFAEFMKLFSFSLFKQASSGVFDEVDWDKWLFGPGMPPVKSK